MKLKTLYLRQSLVLAMLFSVWVGCSKNEAEAEEEIVAAEEEQLPSCVDYSSVDQDDLMTYWNLFVEDVKCSRGGPDYGASHNAVSVRFVVLTPQQQTGVTGSRRLFYL